MNFYYDHNDHNHIENMVQAAFPANEMNMSSHHDVNPETFYTMLESAQRPLYEGCNITELETSVRLLSIKSGHNMSQRCFNEVVGLMKDMYPSESGIPKNYHQQFRKVRDLGMDVQEIDCCLNSYMLYYKQDEGLSACKFFAHANFLGMQDNYQRNPTNEVIRMFHMLKCTTRL